MISAGVPEAMMWPPILARARTEVEYVIGFANRVLIVLDHQHRVAQVAQIFERGDQALVVALVQADGGLVEHIEHAAQARSDLGGQADALAFAAGERGRAAVKRNVAKAHGVEKFQALDDLALQPVSNRSRPAKAIDRPPDSAFSESAVKSAMEASRFASAASIGLGLVARAGRMHGGVHQGSVTASDSGRSLRPWQRGIGRGHELHHVLAIALGLGVLEGVAQPVEDAVESCAADLVARRTVEQQLLLVLGAGQNGCFRLILYFSAASLISRSKYCDDDPGPIAPSSSGLDQSEMILAGSKS